MITIFCHIAQSHRDCTARSSRPSVSDRVTTCKKERGKYIGRDGHVFAGTRLTVLKTFWIGSQVERADIVECRNKRYCLVIKV